MIINAIALRRIQIYKVSNEIWAIREEAQRDVSVDDDEHVDDDEEPNIRDMEEGQPIARGVDEFIASHNVTNER